MREPARVDPLHARGAALALTSAVLFGLSTPYSKILLQRIGPLHLAALLYLGAGVALLLARPLQRRLGVPGSSEASLRAADLPVLLAATFCGAILGPSLMMFGLARVSAVTGSLLLNLEPPLTIVFAVVWFREHLGLRQGGAAALIVAGTALVGYRPGEIASEWPGLLAVALACCAWAIDTNLNQKLSLRDPVELGGVKGLLGGLAILAMATIAGEPSTASWGDVRSALLLGVLAYGASMVMFFRSLRLLGAARVAAYFATAPFVGALASVVVLGERLRGADLAAMGLMAAGLAILLRETHSHEHAHEAMEHDHAHVHDEHHDHAHGPGVLVARRHSHPHRHEPLVHAHPHAPDLHHRHRHD